jgi:hypothetical protein
MIPSAAVLEDFLIADLAFLFDTVVVGANETDGFLIGSASRMNVSDLALSWLWLLI